MAVLRLGSKYKSAVCDTKIMAIRVTAGPLDLRCGGVPMLEGAAASSVSETLREGFADGTLIGKRYVGSADTIELLCIKGGKGSLSPGETRLEVKQAKALPSSD
jgi:hypothetical protein